MKLEDAFNNRSYRRPCWDGNYITFHNGRWFSCRGIELDKSCIVALNEYDDFEGVDVEPCLGVVQSYRDNSSYDGIRFYTGLSVR